MVSESDVETNPRDRRLLAAEMRTTEATDKEIVMLKTQSRNRTGIALRSAIEVMTITVMGTALLAGCSPEVGSENWCEKLEKTHKADWSTRDATAYAKNCIFR